MAGSHWLREKRENQQKGEGGWLGSAAARKKLKPGGKRKFKLDAMFGRFRLKRKKMSRVGGGCLEKNRRR